MGRFSAAKKVVLDYYQEMEERGEKDVLAVMQKYVAPEYHFRGVYPFEERFSREEVAEVVWIPLMHSLKHMQRRMDIFLAGGNKFAPDDIWVLSTGNFMGLFDEDWLGIRHTRKLNCLRYAEFNHVADGKITETTLFVDILGFMNMAGVDPIPLQTGKFFVYPGPRMHNGLLFEDAPEEEGKLTLRLMDRLCKEDPDFVDDGREDRLDYSELTEKELAYANSCKTYFTEDMIWFGPCSIGASYTLPRYIEQHGTPFDEGLDEYKFNGHLVRVAEGEFGGFFGWPNLTNTPVGGFLGVPGSFKRVDMRVVDVYWRKGDRLAENWVYIDFLYWYKQQGLDILERTRKILNK